jgi:molybdopterin converting factor small subunit
MVTIRFFAAARDAAGTSAVEVAAGPLGARLEQLGLGARFDEVLAVSTLLCDGLRVDRDDPVEAGATVDVLPPFAGG